MSGTSTSELTAQGHVDAVHAHAGRIFGKVSWAYGERCMMAPPKTWLPR